MPTLVGPEDGTLYDCLIELRPVPRACYDAAFTRARAAPGGTVVVLGEEARAALGLAPRLIHPTVVEGVTYRQLPAPAGGWYEHPTHRLLAGLLVEELMLDAREVRRGDQERVTS